MESLINIFSYWIADVLVGKYFKRADEDVGAPINTIFYGVETLFEPDH